MFAVPAPGKTGPPVAACGVTVHGEAEPTELALVAVPELVKYATAAAASARTASAARASVRRRVRCENTGGLPDAGGGSWPDGQADDGERRQERVVRAAAVEIGAADGLG